MAQPHEKQCKVCQHGPEKIDWSQSQRTIGSLLGIDAKSVGRHRKWAEANGRGPGDPVPDGTEDDPEVTLVLRSRWQNAAGEWLESYRNVTEAEAPAPKWPVIDRPAPRDFSVPVRTHLSTKWETAIAGGDSQIGFRRFEDGTLDPFHDDAAMALFTKIVEIEQPEKTLLLGDIIDLPSQGKYAQEATFAMTTQAALDRTYEWGVVLREATPGEIHLIEGNHDKRLQSFVETNALAAFGLRKAGWPDSWPVMSLPNLLRLDELDITYYDAYPNAHVWINNVLRAEHGTKANSNGSTAEKYLKETPHVSRLFGHSHRQELVRRTTWDRLGRISTQAINPGCLCRTDGAVPSVHGSIGSDGRPASVTEDWQQGAAVIRYTEDKFFVELVQFDDGQTVYQGQELAA